MKRKNLDDINLEDEYWNQGDPIRFTNPETRQMLALAKAGKEDVFCDFGAGFAQNVIVALRDFEVKKAIGVESDDTRAWRSGKRLEELGLDKKGKIIFGAFEDVSDTLLKRVTILFYGLDGGDEIVSRLQEVWNVSSHLHRLVWNNWHPIPEAYPDEVDYPFFLTYFPQTRERFSQRDWLEKVTLQPVATYRNKPRYSLGELWDEFAHNMDVLHFRDDVEEYKKRLRKVAGD